MIQFLTNLSQLELIRNDEIQLFYHFKFKFYQLDDMND